MGGLANLAWVFLKIGFIFFGGGYVLIPLLHRLMVDEYHWLSLKQFLDGVALSQLTPGPLAVLSTYTGFKVGGIPGALVGTVCIFLPCTALMLAIGKRYEKFRSIKSIRETLDGILPAVVGLVAAAAFNLGKTSLATPRDFILLFAGLLILQFTKISPMLIIIGAGAIGYIFKF